MPHQKIGKIKSDFFWKLKKNKKNNALCLVRSLIAVTLAVPTRSLACDGHGTASGTATTDRIHHSALKKS